DQEHGTGASAQGRQQRELDEVLVAIERLEIHGVLRADREEPPCIGPLVERLRRVDPLMALQADEPAPQHRGESLGYRRLADAGRALQKEGLVEREGEMDVGGDAVVGEVAGLRKLGRAGLYRGG